MDAAPPVRPVNRALVSVYDKTGVAEFAAGLAELGVTLVSTGSTAAAIRAAGVAVTEVSEVVRFPEILGGRVKTLHPAIHAGILADRDDPEHVAALEAHGIAPFDLVVVNLYPFATTVADPAVDHRRAVEMIDIGGPAMVRAAAKNHACVGVIVDPAEYAAVLGHLRDEGGLPPDTRRRLAQAAFAHTAAYDTAVARWFGGDEAFPDLHLRAHVKAMELRYGENPQQRAAYYVEEGSAWGIGSARQLHGRELSYNNLLDADAAWSAVSDFEHPCVAIIKHTNPAGLAVADTLADAYPRAFAGDPTSAFGGIVAVNRPLDAATAAQVAEVFTEVVVAPGYDEDALEILQGKRNLRVLEITRPRVPGVALAARSVGGGLLVQEADIAAEDETAWTVPTAASPDDALLDALSFAWRAAKHAKSNAIVLARDGAVVGVGAGQMSRVDSVRIAVEKSGGRCAGAVLASDAFFPFRDGPDAALEAGVTAIIQPGGSVRDDEVVAACDERGVPMVLTGRRHFRH